MRRDIESFLKWFVYGSKERKSGGMGKTINSAARVCRIFKVTLAVKSLFAPIHRPEELNKTKKKSRIPFDKDTRSSILILSANHF
jgi:hypothetical protein